MIFLDQDGDTLRINNKEIVRVMKKSSTGGDSEEEEQEEVYTESRASCKISEIKGLIYGGFSSRFWMLRKHVNSISDEDFNARPFYSWQCITLCLSRREVDLVIPDEAELTKLLKFLIVKLQTLDGNSSSAVPILSAMKKASKKEGLKLAKKRADSQ